MKRLIQAGAIKLSDYLILCNENSFFEKYEGILKNKVTQKDLIEADMDSKNFSDDEFLGKLMSVCATNPISRTLIQLSALASAYNIKEILERVFPGNKDGVTLECACRVALMGDKSDSHMDLISDAIMQLELFFISDEIEVDPLKKIYRFDYRLKAAAAGVDALPTEFINHCDYYDPDLDLQTIYGYDKEYNNLRDRVVSSINNIKNDDPSNWALTVILSGDRESGRFLNVCHIAKEIGISLFVIDYHDLSSLNHLAIIRECFIRSSALVIRNVPAPEKGQSDKIVRSFQKFEKLYYKYIGFPLFITCDKGFKYIPYSGVKCIGQTISPMDSIKSYKVWSGYLSLLGLDDILNAGELAGKLKLSAGQILRVAQSLVTLREAGIDLTPKEIFSACYDVLDDGRYDSIKRVSTDYYFRDLKLDEKNMETLIQIRNQMYSQGVVMGEWGMEKKYSYGRAMSILFSGPPGTGKTMTACALANELGLELYRVDLSQVVDKYVGETQKRLEDIFKKAESTNMVLFFDEADSIMGKRSDTKDSHDKYSNSEIAYVLQRIEEFDGIVIMATNFLQNVDSAFMRRIRYIIHFAMPDSKTRREIWESAFTLDVPLDLDIDFEFLSENFELSGGNIKNIAINAAYLAASEGTPISMIHLMKSLYMELSKDKRVNFTAEFGKYRGLIG